MDKIGAAAVLGEEAKYFPPSCSAGLTSLVVFSAPLPFAAVYASSRALSLP